MGEREAGFTVCWASEGPVATTGNRRGKAKVSCVAVPKPLAPEAEPSASPLQAPAREVVVDVHCPIVAGQGLEVRASAQPGECMTWKHLAR